MDLSLLPSPVSEHGKQSGKALFTIRSANSPSYRLSRRTGIRKTRGLLEEGRERTEGAVEGVVHGAHVSAVTSKEENPTFDGYQSETGLQDSVKGQHEANDRSNHIMSTQLNQNGSTDKTKTELDNNVSVNRLPSSERRGRAEWRRYELPSRSKSFDCRAGKRSPDQDKSHDLFVSSSIRGGGIGKNSQYRRAEWEGERWRVRSSVQLFNFTGTTSSDKDMSQLSHISQTLDRGDRGHTLPSRWRSLSGPGADVRRTAAAPEPQKNRSILERIEKLYGSAGFSKTEDYNRNKDCSEAVLSHHKETASDFTAWQPQMSQKRATDGTFPRRFSSGSTNSPETSTRAFTWTQHYTSEKSPLRTTRTEERLLRGPGQGQTEDRFLEDRGLHPGVASENSGTMSLGRVRGKYSIADQLRSAGEITITPPLNTSSQEEESLSWRDSLRICEKEAVGSKSNKENVKTDELNRTPRGKMGGFIEEEVQKKPNNGEKAAFKCSTENLFELNPQKATTKASELKKVPELLSVSSTDSVKNRINQFEALTQRFPGQSLPRRTFSVPSQISRTQAGVKKSWSEKAIGGQKDKSERFKEAGEAKEMFSKGKEGSTRSLSVDEVGLSLEARGQNVLDLDGDNIAKDFQTYSRFRKTLETPLTGEDQGPHGGFSIDETDFAKIPSPDEVRKKPTSLLLPVCSDTGGQQTSPSPAEDKTPSNTPTNSPHLSPTSQPENPTVAQCETETASKDAAKSPGQDAPLPHGAPATSPHSRKNTSPVSTDVDAGLPYRSTRSVLDMDAWLSGLNSEMNVWNDSEDDDEDDDDDASTQKDKDSNNESDSGESSVTITSNMSQSEQRSFSVSLSDLCNFAGVDCESENDDDNDWQANTRRSASLSSDMSAFSCVSVLPSEELDKLLEDVRSLGDSNLQDYNAVQVVVLHKEVGMGLGFSVAGGVDQNKPVTVHRVFPSGIAAQEGSIQEGDTVLSINGTSLCGCAHWEALRVLRRARIRNLGVVVLRRGEVSNVSKIRTETSSSGPTQARVTEKDAAFAGQRVCVRLEKKGRDLGFSLEGGVGSSPENRPITVQKIFQSGPAGQVFPGDEILEINGVSTAGMRRIEVWNLIRKLPAGPANLVLRRLHQET